ncbi:MAG: DUF721 domain-containing protein [Acidobacteriota bacterium]
MILIGAGHTFRRKFEMESFNTFLPDFLRQSASDNDIAIIFLAELWPQIVGAEMAANSRPLSLNGKSLLVAVPSEVWKNELTEFETTFLNNINRYWRLSLVEHIKFTVNPLNRS